MRLRKWMVFAVIQTALILVAGEVAARIVFDEPLSYDAVLADALKNPERLFYAGTDNTYDIAGLYWNSTTARIRISDHRLIEPDTAANGRQTVLFLGGSTTEAFYVDEPSRWVARLNDDTLAAYNAGQSGANILDKIDSLKYLNGSGLAFDRVVIMTPNNDFAWVRRIGELGYAFTPQDYRAGLRAFTEANTRLSTVDSLAQRFRVFQFISELEPRETVLQAYQRRIDTSKATITPYANCALIQNWLVEFRRVMPGNLAALNQLVQRQGGELLAFSEATSYGAPEDSFLQDWRVPVPCGDGVLTSEDAMLFYDTINALYLEAAQSVGVDTYDIAAVMGVYTNGSDGGRYQYDSIHYTDIGSTKMADIVRGVLHGLS